MTTVIVDHQGQQRDAQWLKQTYGASVLDAGPGPKFALVRVDVTDGPAVIQVKVLDKGGQLLKNQPIADHWPDPELPDLRNQGYKTVWKERAISQRTGNNGETGFGFGGGSVIHLIENGGPHTVWALSQSLPSDGLDRIGWLGDTNHRGPLFLTFQVVEQGAGPDNGATQNAALLHARVLAQELKIRRAPTIDAEAIGTLQAGALVPIKSIGGTHAWVDIGQGRWCAYAVDGTPFMTPVTGTPPAAGMQLRVSVSELSIRTGPNIDFAQIGALQAGAVVNVHALDGKDVWVEFEPGKWSAFAILREPLMQLVSAGDNLAPTLVLKRVLRLGTQGQDVEKLQQALAKRGLYQGGITGDFDAPTETAVKAFQAQANITIDGVVGPQTCGALGWTFSPDEARSLLLQLADLAEREGAKQLEWTGPQSEAEKYLEPLRKPMQRLGHIGSEPVFYNWCAAFVFWCCQEVGIVVPERPDEFFATMALVESWRHWAQNREWWHPKQSFVPKRGDILVFDWDHDATLNHIGIVTGYTANSSVIHTAEGNAANHTGNLTRNMDDVVGFIRIE